MNRPPRALLPAILGVTLLVAQEKPPVPQVPATGDSRQQDITELMALTGQAEAGRRELTRMLAVYRRHLPRVPADVWSRLENSIDPQGLDRAVAEAYGKLLTEEEVRAALEFYRTPAGRKFARSVPALATEMIKVQTEWRTAMTNEIHKALNASVAGLSAPPEPQNAPETTPAK